MKKCTFCDQYVSSAANFCPTCGSDMSFMEHEKMTGIVIEHTLQNLYTAIEEIRDLNEYAWFFLLNTYNAYFSDAEIKKELDDYLNSKNRGCKKIEGVKNDG